MRAFLALWPDSETALAIDRWRSLCWRNLPGAVPVQNLHLTLAFLGDIERAQVERLTEALDRISAERIEVPLCRVGYQVDQNMLWLEPGPELAEQAAPLHRLVDAARHASGKAGIAVRKGLFRPHVTLARRVEVTASSPLMEPSFSLVAEDFHLVSSERRPGGPHYRIVRSWPSSQ